MWKLQAPASSRHRSGQDGGVTFKLGRYPPLGLFHLDFESEVL